MMAGWGWMLLAVLCEVAFASLLAPSEGLTRVWPTIFVVVFAVIAVLALAKAAEHVPTTTAYVTFVGLGTLGATVVAVVLHGERLSPLRLAAILLIVAGAVGLHLSSGRP